MAMTTEYNVMWNVDLDADNPLEAAKAALAMMQDEHSEARYFEVMDSEGTVHNIDLLYEDDPT